MLKLRQLTSQTVCCTLIRYRQITSGQYHCSSFILLSHKDTCAEDVWIHLHMWTNTVSDEVHRSSVTALNLTLNRPDFSHWTRKINWKIAAEVTKLQKNLQMTLCMKLKELAFCKNVFFVTFMSWFTTVRLRRCSLFGKVEVWLPRW